jgi:type I restriction enzyme, R subunit
MPNACEQHWQNKMPIWLPKITNTLCRLLAIMMKGKRELENFINPEEKYPVIATTSELMTTGVDAQTCKVIVLDANINSMTKFKQIIGRGTRINEEFGKLYFTILDFRNATDLFADKDFDGDPIRVKPVSEDKI